MQDRPTLTKPQTAKDNPTENVGQGRPKPQRFWLEVDRQTKSSFPTLAEAEKIGLTIKKANPAVRVSVYDSAESAEKIIETK